MGQTELYEKLITAYSDENLNNITGKLIDLYKKKDYLKIRTIANKISEFIVIDEEKESKLFSRLIVLYHPDKGASARKIIKESHRKNDLDTLSGFSHILLLENIEFETTTPVIDKDVEYNVEYNWDENQNDGYQFFDDSDRGNNDEFEDVDTDEFTFNDDEKSFYNAVKLRMYGNPEIEFPTYYLEDFEDFELASQGIVDLDGIQYCKHATSIDVSNNEISDIRLLWELPKIQELFLANNNIGYIDALSNLLNLCILDLSGNQIDDISPLFELHNLEYVNLIGNRISDDQIKALRDKDILVMY